MDKWRAFVEMLKSIERSDRPWAILAAIFLWRTFPAIILMALVIAGKDLPTRLMTLLM